jgi:hypothetical protein
MSKTIKQTLKLQPYFKTPVVILNLWVTLCVFIGLFIGAEMMRKSHQKELPDLEKKITALQQEREKMLKDIARDKYKSDKTLGPLIGIMPTNIFFNESSRDFSNELRTLSKIKLKDTWLTSITFNRKKNFIDLTGFSIDPKNVNHFNDFLKTSSVFKNYHLDDTVSVTDANTLNNNRRKRGNGSSEIRKYKFSIKNQS